MKLPEDAWPARKIQDKPTGYDELKRSSRSQEENSESLFVSVAYGSVDFPLRPCNCSSWLRLRRVMASGLQTTVVNRGSTERRESFGQMKLKEQNGN